jgi:chromosomal replication initiator protein
VTNDCSSNTLFADGADVVASLTEIPFPGRAFPVPAGAAMGRTPCHLPWFVAGPENGLAAAVVRQLLSSPELAAADADAAAIPPSPILVFYGPSGLGKSHLLRGLVDCWPTGHGTPCAEYVMAGDFRRQFIDAMKRDCVEEFRRRIRGFELLAIDDLDDLPPDQYVMEELRNTLDDCEPAGGIVVAAAARAPSSLGNLSADVRSRLAGGLVLQLAAPGLEARILLLRHAATALQCTISDEAARVLASGVSGTASTLFGALFELLSEGPTSIQLGSVERYLATRDARRTTLREIIAVVARYYGLPQKLLKSGSRRHAVVVARSTIVYLARALAAASYEQIGQALGGRDHSTIMYNFRTIERDRRQNCQTQETLEELERVLRSC